MYNLIILLTCIFNLWLKTHIFVLAVFSDSFNFSSNHKCVCVVFLIEVELRDSFLRWVWISPELWAECDSNIMLRIAIIINKLEDMLCAICLAPRFAPCSFHSPSFCIINYKLKFAYTKFIYILHCYNMIHIIRSCIKPQ